MDNKKFLGKLNFVPKENSAGVFIKKYPQAGNYAIEVGFEKEHINYGDEIKAESKTTQNFSQSENFVVLECVNRLLEKGYKPKNIVLEKIWGSGHGTSGRLDICVTRDNGSEYLLIECKTHGKEFDKEFSRMKKDGGQLFTYFKFSNKADVIMLYASELQGKEIIYRNEIVKIEDDYRTGDVKDFYEKWNKLTKDNGVFDTWVKPYNFQSKALTKEQLKEIHSEDSSFIFNRFLEILRHNVVSDKGNAFNKIFTLFLCKVYDETSTLDGEELQFQWKEGIDNHIDFQLRLTELYSKGMQKFLERTVSDFNEEDFNKRCENLNNETKEYLLREVNKLRLEKNNEFAIKEVYDTQSFEENAKVVKEVVELIQGYRIRYNKRQQYLSDFFEQLLTTGLKQEAGQFFTPVPISQFIIKSLPIDTIVSDKLKQKDGEILPYMIDYAAGSGHFITEYMHEVQRLISQSETEKYIDSTAKKIKNWKDDHFDWATQYVYGIEKDYRLVKVGKVGCYLHGDGLANVILSDGLANFNKCKDYKLKLKKDTNDTSKDNQQFDILLSNPPYSVSAFRQTTRDYYTENDFELYENLTDDSSEIECLFIERTKQLLKDYGVAGIILPSSILSNEEIYTKAREIILKFFEIVAITKLGSNTFMATGTNTVALFLRRRNNYDSINLKESVERFFMNFQDITLNGIERPFRRYVEYVWEGLSWEDYLSLLKNDPYNFIETECELYREYRKNLKFKTEKEFWQKFIETEKEKILYFILTYPQKVVLVKTGEKDAEKRFLGYEFSNRRGSEGIHPIQRGKTIAECTKLFDEERFDNEEKASTYIYKAFSDDYDFPIHENLKNNISRVRLVDMLIFDRANFTKNISMAVKKTVKIESKFPTVPIAKITNLIESGSRPQGGVFNITEGVYSLGGEHINNKNGYLNLSSPKFVPISFYENATRGKLQKNDLLICKDGALTGKVAIVRDELYNIKAMINEHIFILRCENLTTQKYLFHYLFSENGQILLKNNITGAAQGGLNSTNLQNIKIPLPPKEIQQKIVSEIEVFEKKEKEAKEKIENRKEKIENICLQVHSKYDKEKLIRFAKTNPSKIEIANLDTDTLISFVDMPSVSNDGYIANKIDKSYSEIKKGSYTYFRENDIIIAKITPCMENGKCALATNLTNGLAMGSSEFHVIRTNNDKVNAKYLFTLLNRKPVRTEAEKNMTGASGHRRVPIVFYENLEIPLPPLSKQQKIVSDIEKIETQIAEAQKIIDETAILKNEVLKKYGVN